MHPHISKNTTDDGTIDIDYTFGRPVTAYVSTLQHLKLLLLKARFHRDGPVDQLRLVQRWSSATDIEVEKGHQHEPTDANT